MADRVVKYDDRARIRILEAYDRARTYAIEHGQKPPTQGQFMRAGAPGAHIEKAPGKFRNDESAARYFRKIKTGERSGGAMYRAGQSNQNLYQIRLRHGPGKQDYFSSNIGVESGESSFDIYAIQQELKRGEGRADLEKIIARYRSKYGHEEYVIDPDDVEVRPIQHQRKPLRMHLSIGEYMG